MSTLSGAGDRRLRIDRVIDAPADVVFDTFAASDGRPAIYGQDEPVAATGFDWVAALVGAACLLGVILLVTAGARILTRASRKSRVVAGAGG